MTNYVLHDTKHLRHATADYQSISKQWWLLHSLNCAMIQYNS